jgi:YVTN family beta-propeller protein
VTVSPDGSTVYIFYTSPGGNGGKVALISTTTAQIVNTFQTVGSGGPKGVAIRADGAEIYGANSSDYANGDRSDLGGAVSIFNTATGTTTTWIGPVGRDPQWVAVTPNGQQIYVANAGDTTVSVISTATNKVTGSISVLRAGGMAVSPNGENLYVTGMWIFVPGASGVVNGVAIISTVTNTITAAVPVWAGANAYNPLAMSADGQYLYA